MAEQDVDDAHHHDADRESGDALPAAGHEGAAQFTPEDGIVADCSRDFGGGGVMGCRGGRRGRITGHGGGL